MTNVRSDLRLVLVRGQTVANYRLRFMAPRNQPTLAAPDITGIEMSLTIQDPSGDVVIPMTNDGAGFVLNIDAATTVALTAGVHRMLVTVRDPNDGDEKVQRTEVEVI